MVLLTYAHAARELQAGSPGLKFLAKATSHSPMVREEEELLIAECTEYGWDKIRAGGLIVFPYNATFEDCKNGKGDAGEGGGGLLVIEGQQGVERGDKDGHQEDQGGQEEAGVQAEENGGIN